MLFSPYLCSGASNSARAALQWAKALLLRAISSVNEGVFLRVEENHGSKSLDGVPDFPVGLERKDEDWARW